MLNATFSVMFKDRELASEVGIVFMNEAQKGKILQRRKKKSIDIIVYILISVGL